MWPAGLASSRATAFSKHPAWSRHIGPLHKTFSQIAKVIERINNVVEMTGTSRDSFRNDAGTDVFVKGTSGTQAQGSKRHIVYTDGTYLRPKCV
jgi:hypothetical protein